MKKSTTKTNTSSSKINPDLNKKLIENFVSLQKVMANLSVKFDNLSDQITKLLELFEISAKAMAENEFNMRKDSDDGKILEKLDSLLEQNKVIAKGLTMLHEGEIPEEGIHKQIQQYQQGTNQRQKPQRQLLPSERSRLQRIPPKNYY